jgi:RNA-directed DNA polymerase
MRRAGHLMERIADPENLREAFLRASRGKAGKAEVIEYRASLQENLDNLRRRILDGSVPVGGYRQFVIHDPKERVITVAPFSQRVLHHAVMMPCEPYFENRLVPWTYACRKGKGSLAALATAGRYCRKYEWYLKLDIRKYFDSVPHARLLECLESLFKDRALLNLLHSIVSSYCTQPARGLPIGNLTSQHFANFYLNELDRFLERHSHGGQCAGVRYMDDAVLWAHSKEFLADIRSALREFLPSHLGLELKQERIGRVASGVPFLGCRVFARHRELNRRARVRFVRNVALIDRLLAEGRLAESEAQERSIALFSHAATAQTLDFRRRALQTHFRMETMGMAPTAASAAAAGTTPQTTELSPIATTTPRTTATPTTDSGLPAAQEGFGKSPFMNRPPSRSVENGQNPNHTAAPASSPMDFGVESGGRSDFSK